MLCENESNSNTDFINRPRNTTLLLSSVFAVNDMLSRHHLAQNELTSRHKQTVSIIFTAGKMETKIELRFFLRVTVTQSGAPL